MDLNTSAIAVRNSEIDHATTPDVGQQISPETTLSSPLGATNDIERFSPATGQRERVAKQASPSKKRKSNPTPPRSCRHVSRPDPDDAHECEPNQEEQPSYLGRSDYVSGHIAIDEGDATQYRTLASTTRAVQDLKTQILGKLTLVEPPEGMFRQTLIRNFMQRCRPWMPLIEEFDLPKLDLKNVNCLLTTAMLVAGSVVSSAPQAIEVSHRCYHRAKVLFYTGAEKNDIRVVMATILFHWLSPSGPEHVSIDSNSFWLKVGVGLAQQLGLHREPSPRMEDAGLRRRIWWTLVVVYPPT